MADGKDFPVEILGDKIEQIEPKPDYTPITERNETSTFLHEKLRSTNTTPDKKRPISWQLIRFLGFFFIGWSGFQIVFLPSLIFIIINNESYSTFISSLFSESKGFLPLIIFCMITYLVIMFIMHLLTEMEYRSRLDHYIISWKDIPTLLVNYGIPLLTQFLFVMILQTVLFIVITWGYMLLSSMMNIHLDLNYMIYRTTIVFITFPWIIMQFMLDTTLERGIKGKSFSYCYHRARFLIIHRTGDIFRYLLIRLTLIMLSLVFFKILIYTVVLPLKIYLFYDLNLNTNILFGNMITSADVLINAGKLIVGLSVIGILFSIIATPLYWFNTRLIRNYLSKSSQI